MPYASIRADSATPQSPLAAAASIRSSAAAMTSKSAVFAASFHSDG